MSKSDTSLNACKSAKLARPKSAKTSEIRRMLHATIRPTLPPYQYARNGNALGDYKQHGRHALIGQERILSP